MIDITQLLACAPVKHEDFTTIIVNIDRIICQLIVDSRGISPTGVAPTLPRAPLRHTSATHWITFPHHPNLVGPSGMAIDVPIYLNGPLPHSYHIGVQPHILSPSCGGIQISKGARVPPSASTSNSSLGFDITFDLDNEYVAILQPQMDE